MFTKSRSFVMDAKQLAQQALEDHERLNRDAKGLIKLLNLEHEDSTARWFEKCGESFRTFHTQLRRHIETEELGGFMKPVCERRPTLTREVERLLEEHHDLLAECTNIEEFFCLHKEPTNTDCSRGRHDAMALIAKLECHEASENNLIQDVFNLDIGTGD